MASPTTAPRTLAPDLAEIEDLALRAARSLPEPFRTLAQEVVIQVEDFATEEVLQDLDIDDPYELTGLYLGVPLTEKSLDDPVLQPDMVVLFRRAILDEWIGRGTVTLEDLVTHVTIHEFAHHFGWSDEEIAEIDPWWED